MIEFLHNTHTHSLSKRNSYIECLRIIASFFIVLHHFTEQSPSTFNLMPIDILYFTISCHFGNLGNCIFITVSAFYLSKNRETKFNKIIFLLIIELIISLISLYISYIIKYPISKRDIFIGIAPFLTNTIFWFINAYILYYAIHELLNKLIDVISKREHLCICICVILLYTFIPMFTHKIMPTSILTSFIVIHFIISFFDKYISIFNDKKITLNIAIFSFLIYFIGIFVSYFLVVLTKKKFFARTMYVNVILFYNIFIVLGCISLIYYLNEKKWYNSTINYWGHLSPYIFMIHFQTWIIKIAMTDKWVYLSSIYSTNKARLLLLTIAILVYILTVIISIICKTFLEKPIQKISDSISIFVDMLIDKLMFKIH